MSHYGDHYRAERERAEQAEREYRERRRQRRVDQQRETQTCGNCGKHISDHIQVSSPHGDVLICPLHVYNTDV